MSKILVTGATGFIGRRLCRALVDRGDEVIAAVREESRTHVLPPQVRCITVGEIGPQTHWGPALLNDIDYVAHLAAKVHLLHDDSRNPAEEFHRVNVLGTKRLAEAVMQRVKRFVYVSSLHAMCSLHAEILNEESDCQPDTPYGQSKLEAEDVLKNIGDESPMEITVLRPPPVYGPGQLGNLLRLFQAVRNGWPLPLGRLRNQRSLVYVENLVDVLGKCIHHPKAAGETFLVNDGENISISQLLKKTGFALDKPAKLIPAPKFLMKLAGRVTGKSSAVDRLLGSLAVDSSKIRDALDWNPRYSLEDGLKATAKWLRAAA